MSDIQNHFSSLPRPRQRFAKSSTEPFNPFKIFTPSGIFGYGYDLDEFWKTVDDEQPAAIILDAGSTDPGPSMLGTGKTLCAKASYIRDVTPILEACATYGTKFLVSSAGGAGINAQVDNLVDIIREVADSNGWSFKLASIKFNDDRNTFLSKFKAGKTQPCGPGPELTEADINNATAIVAQMGTEPFMKAMEDDEVDIIVAGRSYDPAPFAAFCMLRGVDESPAWHVGKIIECGGLCAVPKGRSIVADMHKDHFILTPTNPVERCTPVSVAAHTLYEKTRPDRLPGPGGILYLEHATYEQLPDGRSVHCQGSKFVPSPAYQIKLEGAEQIGYRTIYIGGIRDPILIDGIDVFIETVKTTTKQAFPDFETPDGPQLNFHVYGKNAVMGPLETAFSTPHELGIMGEVVASSQEVADAVAGFSRTVLLHGSYEGQLNTGGNLALPLTPLETSLGPVFKFSLYHLMDVEDPTALFPISTTTIGPAGDRAINLDERMEARNAKRKAVAPAIPVPLPPNAGESNILITRRIQNC